MTLSREGDHEKLSIQKHANQQQQQPQQQQQQAQHHHQHQQVQQNGLYLEEWQKKWKSIMKSSVVYFDLSNAQDYSNKEREAATRLFTGAGATLAPFFDNNVTIVITKRPKSQLPKNMANNEVIKVWDYEKVFRFFKNLGERLPHERDNNGGLSTMWQDEKLHGAADRDPSAKRDDIHYFKNPFFHVYDLRDIAKPVAAREWRSKEKWPQMYNSSCGHSLFQEDPSDMFDERKKKRRKLREHNAAGFRRKLREVYAEPKKRMDPFMEHESEDSTVHSQNETSVETANDTMDHTAQGGEEPSATNTGQEKNMVPPMPEFRLPALSRQGSALVNKFLEAQPRHHGEIQASGYNGSVSQQSNEVQTRNGLAPTVATTASKQLNRLQAMVVKRPTVSATKEHSTSRKEKVPGYCENCKNHFDDFDEHIVSLKHREFAENDANFAAIDDLIDNLMQKIKNKQ